MKRLLVIPIMFFYLFAVTGVMIHVHYCGQELESWNVYAQNEGCPDSECGDEKGVPDDCCKDEVIAAKISYDQNTVSEFKIKFAPVEWMAMQPVAFSVYKAPAFSKAAVLADNRSNAPPGLWQHIPLYKLHTSFTYYG